MALWGAPVDPRRVDAVYAESWYVHWQRLMTGVSNALPVAGIDVLLLAAIGFVSWQAWRALSPAARGRRWRVTGRGLAGVLLVVATAALGFLLSWGLNYRRAPMTTRLDHHPSRIGLAQLLDLTDEAVRTVNQLHGPAHSAPWPTDGELVSRLDAPFREALRLVGLPDTVVGVPKPTLLGWWLSATGVAGFTSPWTLDIVITPDALPFERPALVLHEWAHLAGVAHEAEAEFVAWLAGVRGDEQVRHSAWFSVLPRLVRALPPPARRQVMRRLESGPLADMEAVGRRLRRVRPVMRDLAWTSYDAFLRANRVESGLGSYDEVVALMAGTAYDDGWRPRLVSGRR